MSNEIEKFDPSKLMDGVKDRIKATFASLIPDEQWQQLVKTQYDAFFDRPWDGYNKKETPSNFDKLCKQILEEVAKEKIKELLTQYASDNWSNNGLIASEALKELLTENADKIFINVISSMMQSVIYSMQNSR